MYGRNKLYLTAKQYFSAVWVLSNLDSLGKSPIQTEIASALWLCVSSGSLSEVRKSAIEGQWQTAFSRDEPFTED